MASFKGILITLVFIRFGAGNHISFSDTVLSSTSGGALLDLASHSPSTI